MSAECDNLLRPRRLLIETALQAVLRPAPGCPGRGDERPDSGADVIGKGRPHGNKRSQFGIGDAPFALLVTTPGTTPGRGRRLISLVFLALFVGDRETHNP